MLICLSIHKKQQSFDNVEYLLVKLLQISCCDLGLLENHVVWKEKIKVLSPETATEKLGFSLINNPPWIYSSTLTFIETFMRVRVIRMSIAITGVVCYDPGWISNILSLSRASKKYHVS
jgi:hypothetical protein